MEHELVHHPDLLALAAAYVEATGKSEATVANYAGTDGRFFARIRQGARCWPEMQGKLRQWFSDHWPADVVWPEGVVRPAANTDTGPARRPQWGKSAAQDAA